MTRTSVRASFRIQSAIVAKRNGERLSAETIEGVVADYLAADVDDAQMAAWLATVACRGLDLEETVALTRAYVATGTALNLSRTGRRVADKHSTGGVGDKATLVVVPVVAACGVPVVKMSGRGLGFAGGTIDKLESIPGLDLALTSRELIRILDESGMVITGQSDDLAPGDGATYRLRDVTGTVESIPLIAASIISKKAAVGAAGLVLDVKSGPGALMVELSDATALARLMIRVGAAFGLDCRAFVTDMSQPSGRAVGNALEVREAVAVLGGRNIRGLTSTCWSLATAMLQSVEQSMTADDARARITAAITSGRALEVFASWTRAQGATLDVTQHPERLARAQRQTAVRSAIGGWVHSVSPRTIGQLALEVGAGRARPGAALDYGAGLTVEKRVGDYVEPGELLVTVHHAARLDAAELAARAAAAFDVRTDRSEPISDILGLVTADDVQASSLPDSVS